MAGHVTSIVIVSLPITPIHFSGSVRVVLSSSEDLTRGPSTREALGDNKEYSFADLFSLAGASLGQLWSAIDNH